MEEYRNSLAASFLFRFYVELVQFAQQRAPGFSSPLPQGYEGAAARYHRPPASGLQYYSKTADGDVIGQPYRHMSADVQVRLSLQCQLFLFIRRFNIHMLNHARCTTAMTAVWLNLGRVR